MEEVTANDDGADRSSAISAIFAWTTRSRQKIQIDNFAVYGRERPRASSVAEGGRLAGICSVICNEALTLLSSQSNFQERQ